MKQFDLNMMWQQSMCSP